MDVNRDNFYDVLPEILGNIESADFISFDGEFSGILGFNKLNYFDTVAERYQRHYQVDRHYLLIQFGISTIKIQEKENSYKMNSYNFYLFPENEFDGFDFRSRTSSLQFLAQNHFDFNQLFLKGIPFVCKTQQVSKLRARERYEKKNDGNDTTQTTFVSDEELLEKSMNGFSTVVWKIQQSGKPIIGHNVHMDLLHLINQFFTPLPEDYDDYRTIVKNLFPKIIDTKVVASLPIFKTLIQNTALQAVYQSIRQEAFPPCDFVVPENFSYATTEKEHNAGYDATCTAVIFLKMINYIKNHQQLSNPSSQDLSFIESFYGKVFFMRSFDIQYSNFLEQETLPDRSSVFYMKHPAKTSNTQIRDFCQTFDVRNYDRIDAFTTIIGVLMKNETVENILTKLRANDKNFTITPYNEYRQANGLIPTPEHPETIAKRPKVEVDDVQRRETAKRSYGDVSEASSNPATSLSTLMEAKAKMMGQQKKKLFDYDDEW